MLNGADIRIISAEKAACANRKKAACADGYLKEYQLSSPYRQKSTALLNERCLEKRQRYPPRGTACRADPAASSRNSRLYRFSGWDNHKVKCRTKKPR